jgi:lactate dehydrogenase-like 2-hydroxyacid dehydrogenase
MRIVVAAPIPQAVADRARAEFDAALSQDNQLDAAALVERLRSSGAEGALVTTRQKLGAEQIAAFPDHVKIIATYSVGFEHIDIKAAAARNIVVTNTPDVLTDATADIALMLLLCAARRAKEYAQIMDNGWGAPLPLSAMLGTDLNGKALGIVGMGRIGQAVARRARAFGMRILYHSRNRLPESEELEARYFGSVDEMLPRCNFLSLHMPSNGEALLTEKRLNLLPRGAILVNTARGNLIDEEALLAALQSGQIGAAGLDVFLKEPAFDIRFRDIPNVFITPHVGSATIETRNAMGFRALDNLAQFAEGHRPMDAVALQN